MNLLLSQHGASYFDVGHAESSILSSDSGLNDSSSSDGW